MMIWSWHRLGCSGIRRKAAATPRQRIRMRWVGPVNGAPASVAYFATWWCYRSFTLRRAAWARLAVAAHGPCPQWCCCDVAGRGGGVAVGDRDLDRAGAGPVSRCRPCWAVRWWLGGVGSCAVVVGSAGGGAGQGGGGPQMPRMFVGGFGGRGL